jgi:uncharacterized protein YdcH (DUF465 family)
MIYDIDWSDEDKCFVGWLSECGMCCHGDTSEIVFNQLAEIHESFKDGELSKKQHCQNIHSRFDYYKQSRVDLKDEIRQLKQKINALECNVAT